MTLLDSKKPWCLRRRHPAHLPPHHRHVVAREESLGGDAQQTKFLIGCTDIRKVGGHSSFLTLVVPKLVKTTKSRHPSSSGQSFWLAASQVVPHWFSLENFVQGAAPFGSPKRYSGGVAVNSPNFPNLAAIPRSTSTETNRCLDD